MRKRNWDATQEACKHVRAIEKALAEIGAAVESRRASYQDGDCDWAKVGTLGRIEEQLTEITDALYHRGEHAPENDAPPLNAAERAHAGPDCDCN